MPDGLGSFTFKGGFGMIPFKIEGEWKYGKLNGKSIQYYSEADRKELESKEGRYHGKYIRYYEDGRKEIKEFRNGQQTGLERKYNKGNSISSECMFDNGR